MYVLNRPQAKSEGHTENECVNELYKMLYTQDESGVVPFIVILEWATVQTDN